MAFDLATAKPVEAGGFDLASAKPDPVTTAPVERSLPAQLIRGVGRTARAGVQGLFALPNMIGDAVGLRSSEALRNALTKVGLPQAENPTERVSEDVAGGMAGAGGLVKLGTTMATKGGSRIIQKIGEMLAPPVGEVSTAPGLVARLKNVLPATTTGTGGVVVSGGTGPGAASVVREEGGGPIAQLAAGVAGGAVPLIPAVGASATRGSVRGGEAGRQRVAQNIETFENSGAGTPTVGQATEGRGNRALESVLSKMPGGAGRMAAKGEAESAGLGGKVEEIASNIAGRTGAAPTGRQIKSGLEQFVEDFKGSSGKLYDELDRHIPKATQVEVGNTREALAKLNADIPGAPNLSKWFKNSKIQGIEGALKADTSGQQAAEQGMNPFQLGMLKQLPMSEAERTSMFNAFDEGKLPYEALKKLRTLVGNEISDSTIASDVPRSKWKPLYAALTKDMGLAAQEAGPKAEAAFVRANNFHRAGMQRLDDVLGPIMKKGDPEDVFRAALSGTQEGATTINGVMKSLPTESRKAVAATMLQRLGKATPGKQNDLGEVFSTETFLTNWNKLHPDAKRVLFSTLPDTMRSDLDKIAKVASNVRDGSKVFANPSGTAAGAASSGQTWGTAAAAFMAVLTGHPEYGAAAIAGSAATAGASNATARLMTSPKFVHWLAKSTRAPVEQIPAQLNQLFQESLYMKGDERKDARAFVKAAREATR